MPSSVQTYDPAKQIAIFAANQITGFADGTFIEIERNADAFTLAMGADGQGARAKSADKSGTIKFTLLQTSASNDVLSAQQQLDELTGAGLAGFMLKDAGGRTVAVAQTAWVKKPADVKLSKDIEGREWTLETDSLTYFVGGN
jgi:hypothetical protein